MLLILVGMHVVTMKMSTAYLGDLLVIWRIYEDYDLEPEPEASVFWNTTQYRIYEFDATGSKLKEITIACMTIRCFLDAINHFVLVLKNIRLSRQIRPTL